jgi:hypothetical protein
LHVRVAKSNRPEMFGDIEWRRSMKIGKMAALVTGIMFVGQASAAVTPSVATLSTPLASGARVGAPIRSASHFGPGGGGVIIAALAAGVIGGGVYLAVKKDHHDNVSVSP